MSGLSADHDDSDDDADAPAPSAPARRRQRTGQQRREQTAQVAGPPSSIFAASTIHIGPFAIVRRHIAGVPAMFVHCPLHTYKDSDGTVHRCSKSMQLNQPSEPIVIKRLHQWVYAGPWWLALFCRSEWSRRVVTVFCRSVPGTQMVPAPSETQEDLRLRHVRTVTCSQTTYYSVFALAVLCFRFPPAKKRSLAIQPNLLHMSWSTAGSATFASACASEDRTQRAQGSHRD